MEIGAGPGLFPTTHWSLVVRAGQEPLEGKRRALAALLKLYLPALRTHLTARKRIAPERADDLLQGFLADRVLEQDLLAKAEQSRGRFRTFLLTALDRYILNVHRDATAKKRAPTGGLGSLDDGVGSEARAEDAGASEVFEVSWARQLLGEAVRRMKEHCHVTARPDVWGVFECRVLLPTLEGAEPTAYPDLVRQFNFISPAQASNVMVTGQRMFGRILKSVVAEYEQNAQDIDAEIADLREILARGRGMNS